MTSNSRVIRGYSLKLPDEAATEALAASFAPLLCSTHPGTTAGRRIHLRGDLGAGKTSFVRAFLRAADVQGRIKSPSYALLESYNLSSLHFYHLGFYRFSDTREWLDAGLRDILQENSIVLIEWPEQAGTLLPPPDLDIRIEHEDEGRTVVLTPHSDKGSLWLTTLFPTTPPLPTSPADG